MLYIFILIDLWHIIPHENKFFFLQKGFFFQYLILSMARFGYTFFPFIFMESRLLIVAFKINISKDKPY